MMHTGTRTLVKALSATGTHKPNKSYSHLTTDNRLDEDLSNMDDSSQYMDSGGYGSSAMPKNVVWKRGSAPMHATIPVVVFVVVPLPTVKHGCLLSVM